MDSPYHIALITDETPDIRELHKQCLDCGLATTPDGRTDIVKQYRINEDLQRDSDRETALAALETSSQGSIYYWTDSGMMLRVGYTRDPSETEEWWGRIVIGFQTSEIDRSHHDDEDCQSRIEDLLSVVQNIVSLVDPNYVWSTIVGGHGRYKKYIPKGQPVSDNIEQLSWLTVMSESVVEQFGGRKHVLATPAWEIRELDTGHIMLVLEDHPYDPQSPVSESPEEHLFH